MLRGDHARDREKGPTVRSIVVGLFMVALVNVWVTHAEYIAHTSRMNITHFPISLFALFIVMVGLNILLRRLHPGLALSPSEQLTVIGMGLIGAAIPAFGLTGIFLGLLASPYYLATPENQWAEYLHEHIPSWMVPSNSHNAMRWLFEGLPEGERIPWEAWVVPLFWWLSLIGAIAFVSLCIVVILRKQWVEHEKLVYPLLSPVVDMVSESEGRRRLPKFLRGWLFWVGFALPFFIYSWNMISYFSPGFPRINLSPNQGLFYFARYFPPLLTHLNFYTMGFAYFVNLEVLFSIWFFHLVLMTEIAMFRRVGFAFSATHKAGGGWGDPIIQWQCAGAFVLFVLWGLWMARRHIRDVGRKAFWGDASVDDRNELLSYRMAVFGLIIGLLFIMGWLRGSGMAFTYICLFVPAVFVIYIGMAKIIAECGTLYLSNPIGPQDFAVQILGTDSLSRATMVAMTFSQAWRCQGKGLFMPPLAYMGKIADLIKGNKRALCAAGMAALIFGLGVAVVLSLFFGYRYGAYNFHDFPFTLYSPRVLSSAVSMMKDPEPTSWERISFFGIGGVLVTALTLLRYRLPWWPLHPVGFIITTTNILHEITSIFIVWTVKSIVLRIGGVAFYRRLRPLFIGLIVGKAAAVAVSYLVDQIWFPGAGHGVHSWV